MATTLSFGSREPKKMVSWFSEKRFLQIRHWNNRVWLAPLVTLVWRHLKNRLHTALPVKN